MNERINTSAQTLSLVIAVGITLLYFFTNDFTLAQLLTFLILTVAVIEVISLGIVAKIYPESHTHFKIGIIATLIILLGIKSMLPSFFAPLTITVLVLNFLYNFYTNSKRQKGAFKRKPGKKIQF